MSGLLVRMGRYKSPAGPACCLFLLLSGHVLAADDAVPPAGYARVNQSLLENHVLPRYERLVDATGRFADAVTESCAGRAGGQVDLLRGYYHQVMDAWMGVQHLRFGPVELFMRSFRLYFWPEARGKVGRAVEALLAEPAPLAAAELPDASVAVQGLPAVEYLLYAEDGSDGGDTVGPARRCALLTAVTRNMADMAAGIVADWQGGDVHFRQSFLQPGPDNAFYKRHADATLDLFKSLHGGLRLIADVKLKPVVGEDIAAARPGLAESRRSSRALRNIVVNLEALETLYVGEGGPGLGELVAVHAGDAELDALMRKAFRMTLETARGIDPPFARAVEDEARRAATEKLLTRVRALKQIVRSRVASALGLTVGFNALDGD